MRSAAILILALVAAVVVAEEFPGEEESQLQIVTTDDLETSALKGDLTNFDQYCLVSRDHVFADIKQNSNALSSRMFRLVFDSAENLGREAIQMAQVGNERLTNQLANPDGIIAPASNEAEEIIARGQESIKDVQVQPRAILEAFRASVSAISRTVGNHVSSKISELKSIANVDQLSKALENACATVERLEGEIKNKYEEYKASLVAENPALAKYQFADIPCVTSRRISRIDGLCKFVSAVSGPVNKVWRSSRVQ